jgi:hypothetical protein
MNIWWCRGCGMESTREGSCPTCAHALQSTNVRWLNPNDEGEETVFELEPEPIERAAIVDALIHESIRHRWETNFELVVADARADEVDGILDEVLGVETRADDNGIAADLGNSTSDEDFDEDNSEYDESDEDGYSAISKLYIATDKLQSSRDHDEIMSFAGAVGEVLMGPLPFGMEDEAWADILSAARNAATALEQDPEAPIDADIKALRNQLHELV